MPRDRIYNITISENHINSKKIIIIVLFIILAIELVIVGKSALEMIKQNKVYEQYEAQIMALKKKEEDKQVEIKKEKQEKIPVLTRGRKGKHRAHLSFRNETSIFNL